MGTYKYFNLAKNLVNKSAKNIKHLSIQTNMHSLYSTLEHLINENLKEDQKCIIFTQTKH